MPRESNNIIERMDKDVKTIGAIIWGALFIMIFFLISAMKFDDISKETVSKVNENKVAYLKTQENLKVRLDEAIIESTRIQLELIADAGKNNITRYLKNNPLIEKNLILRNEAGNALFGNMDGDTLYYNSSIHSLIKDYDNMYYIKDKITKKTLISRVRPEWNDKELTKMFLSTIGELKTSGITGDSFAYDTVTMRMLHDASSDCAPDPHILNKDRRAYLDLIYKHPLVANPVGFKMVIDTLYKDISDTTVNSNLIMLFSEPFLLSTKEVGNNKISNVVDLTKNPLGEYLREFDSKRTLATPLIPLLEVDGVQMKITIVFGSQEPEITAPFKSYNNYYEENLKSIETNSNKIIKQLDKSYSLGTIYPILTALLAMFVGIFSLFAMKNLEKKVHITMLAYHHGHPHEHNHIVVERNEKNKT